MYVVEIQFKNRFSSLKILDLDRMPGGIKNRLNYKKEPLV